MTRLQIVKRAVVYRVDDIPLSRIAEMFFQIMLLAVVVQTLIQRHGFDTAGILSLCLYITIWAIWSRASRFQALVRRMSDFSGMLFVCTLLIACTAGMTILYLLNY